MSFGIPPARYRLLPLTSCATGRDRSWTAHGSPARPRYGASARHRRGAGARTGPARPRPRAQRARHRADAGPGRRIASDRHRNDRDSGRSIRARGRRASRRRTRPPRPALLISTSTLRPRRSSSSTRRAAPPGADRSAAITVVSVPIDAIRQPGLHRLDAARAEHEVVAVPGQFARQRRADAARSTRDEGERANRAAVHDRSLHVAHYVSGNSRYRAGDR